MNVDQIWTWMQEYPTELMWIGIAVGIGVLSVLAALVVRKLRGQDLNAKASIGFGAVQAGVAFITITGVYDFFHQLLKMPAVESGLLAGFIEACVWAAVGMIYTYGKGLGKDGQPNLGFGPAGGFFWATVCGGGLLAILGSSSVPVAIGRIVVVVLGSYMWYLRLLQVTKRSTEKSKWRWTPKRLLLAAGALVPADEDVDDDAREWQVRRIARAIRWRNSSWPWSWLGGRALVKRAEATTQDVLMDGIRRWAAGHVMKTSVKPTSPIMAAVIAAAEKAQMPLGGQASLATNIPRQSLGPTSAIQAQQTAMAAYGSNAGGPMTARVEQPVREKTVVLPSTAASLSTWLANWTEIAKRKPTFVYGQSGISEDEAQNICGVSSRQARNYRTAAMSGQLREKAGELDVELPAGFVDNQTAGTDRSPVPVGS